MPRVLKSFEQVRQYFAESPRRYPRAKLQLLVVWIRHIEGLDYETIVARLTMSVTKVRVLYARSCARLRKDRRWRIFAEELGMIEAADQTCSEQRGQYRRERAR